jgi:hypothetical protein
MHGTLSFVRRDLQQCASGVSRQGFDLQARLHLQLPYYGSSEIEDQEIGSDVAEKYAGPFFDLENISEQRQASKCDHLSLTHSVPNVISSPRGPQQTVKTGTDTQIQTVENIMADQINVLL